MYIGLWTPPPPRPIRISVYSGILYGTKAYCLNTKSFLVSYYSLEREIGLVCGKLHFWVESF